MRILWLVNRPFPEAIKLLTGEKDDLKGSGGWQIASAELLQNRKEVELYIASFSHLVDKTVFLKGKCIYHIIVPKKAEDMVTNLQVLKNNLKPDVIHIHGTEYPHGILYLKACGSERVVVSIQGLVGIIARYYNCGLTSGQILKNLTLYDVFRRQSLFDAKKYFEKIGKQEVETIRSVSHVIGRTTWDRIHVETINPRVHYYHCNESLRVTFYNGCWKYETCIPHTVFLSQATYPVKGLHLALKAFAIVYKHYPDLKVRIAGSDFIHPTSIKGKLKLGGYAKIISKLIKEFGLSNIITFTGPLDAEQMKQEYLRANVFVSPSTIENSPNSLGEAQILGTPCIASYVGGVPDFIPSSNCGELYRFEEYEMLANIICRVFDNSKTFDNTEMRRVAKSRHNPITNTEDTINIYKKIVEIE